MIQSFSSYITIVLLEEGGHGAIVLVNPPAPPPPPAYDFSPWPSVTIIAVATVAIFRIELKNPSLLLASSSSSRDLSLVLRYGTHGVLSGTSELQRNSRRREVTGDEPPPFGNVIIFFVAVVAVGNSPRADTSLPVEVAESAKLEEKEFLMSFWRWMLLPQPQIGWTVLASEVVGMRIPQRGGGIFFHEALPK
ncbi:hypothetical protein MKZ38_007532 [Zalerion maritima]|uniref:Uncharacterized protein n=1 Tax=Zalerion maritima TaxID=339359 RepID=A0AAD5RIQ8_9PEZI|nr:hypothetical protein MKZ38_007532 [Zalerion maritima]